MRRGTSRRYSNRKTKKKTPKPVVVLLTVAMMGGAAFALAWTWQSVQDTRALEAPRAWAAPAENSETDPVPEIVADEPEIPRVDKLQEMQLDGVEEPTEAEEEPADEGFAARPQYSGAVPASARVDNSYFDDSLFLGDSISKGIPLYNVMPNADVIAVQGINTVNINTKEAVPTDDGDVTVLAAAAELGEKGKVYIMLGGNGLGYEKEPFIDGYRTFLQSVKELYPNAVIYVQSMLPVTDYAVEKYPYAENERIEEYNLAIMALTKELGLYYLDVAASLADENGKLPTEYSPLDGMHLSAECYAIWFEYLRTHTVGG